MKNNTQGNGRFFLSHVTVGLGLYEPKSIKNCPEMSNYKNIPSTDSPFENGIVSQCKSWVFENLDKDRRRRRVLANVLHENGWSTLLLNQYGLGAGWDRNNRLLLTMHLLLVTINQSKKDTESFRLEVCQNSILVVSVPPMQLVFKNRTCTKELCGIRHYYFNA
jgi:hypothetical protein